MMELSGISVFSMKQTKSVVSIMYDSCFLVTDGGSKSMKLEMHSVGPLFPQRQNSVCGFYSVYRFLVFWVDLDYCGAT